jgi:hypothetical protein
MYDFPETINLYKYLQFCFNVSNDVTIYHNRIFYPDLVGMLLTGGTACILLSSYVRSEHVVFIAYHVHWMLLASCVHSYVDTWLIITGFLLALAETAKCNEYNQNTGTLSFPLSIKI